MVYPDQILFQSDTLKTCPCKSAWDPRFTDLRYKGVTIESRQRLKFKS